jgi:subtilisin family serine protease
MKRKIAILVLICIIFLASPLYSASFNGKRILKGTWNGQDMEYVEGEILFKLKSKVKLSETERLFGENKAKMVEGPDQLGMGKLELTSPADIFQVIESLNSSELIDFAEPNMIDKAMYPPNDYYFESGTQWGFHNYGQNPPGGIPGADINLVDAWDISPGNTGILIAILDSGIPMVQGFLFHPDLYDTNRYKPGEDIAGDGDWVRDNFGHGTHVLGIIAAMTNNETGVAGVDWNCKILINQVFDGSGIGTHNTFKNGVLHAVDYGARIINYSGGGTASYTKLQAVSYADTHNVLLVAAAGNGFGDSVLYPAHYADNYSNVMAVSATSCKDQLAEYSNYGPSICVAAPGGQGSPWDENDIFSTTPNYPVALSNPPYYLTQDFGYMGGTSMSCGMVTGLASLLLSVDPNFYPLELRETIEKTADKVGDYMYYIETGKSMELGHGRINCYNALVLASGYTYVYGDANGNGTVTEADVVYLINYLYRDGPPPEIPSAGDANGDCTVSTGDVVYLLSYLYRRGNPPLRGCVEE